MWQCMGLLEKHQPQPAAVNREGDGEEVASTRPGGGASGNGGGGGGAGGLRRVLQESQQHL